MDMDGVFVFPRDAAEVVEDSQKSAFFKGQVFHFLNDGTAHGSLYWLAQKSTKSLFPLLGWPQWSLRMR